MLDLAVRDPLSVLNDELWSDWPVMPRRWLRRALRNAEMLDEEVPIDVLKHDGKLIVRMTLPGFTAKEISCEVKDDLVSVKAEHEETSEEKAEDYYRRECRYGTVSRSFALPEVIDADHAEAEYRNGVLTIRAAMKTIGASKQIAIKGD